MAGLRVMVIALVGCRAAEAQPEVTSGVKPPAGWQVLPPVATAARMAVGAGGVIVDGVEAWGDPARGCYGLWIALHGAGGTAEELAQQVLDGLAAEKIATSAVEATGDTLALSLERAPYQGQLRARLGDGKVTALACVANPREREACATACGALYASWRIP